MKTTLLKPAEVRKQWVLVDAAGVSLGRVASQVALVLRGKHRASYTPSAFDGDYVIVINAGKIVLTGHKLQDKMSKRYTGYPGGLKLTPFAEMMEKKPEEVLMRAVWGMLPHGRQSRHQLTGLKIYRDGTHPHEAQQPRTMKFVRGRLALA